MTLAELLKQYVVSIDVRTYENGVIEACWTRRYADDKLSQERRWSQSTQDPIDSFHELLDRIASIEACADELDVEFGSDGWHNLQLYRAVEAKRGVGSR